MYGLQKGSELKEIIVKVNNNTAIRYRVAEDGIDLRDLRREKARLEVEFALPKPSQEELVEIGKMVDPYYRRDLEAIRARLEEIDAILEAEVR